MSQICIAEEVIKTLQIMTAGSFIRNHRRLKYPCEIFSTLKHFKVKIYEIITAEHEDKSCAKTFAFRVFSLVTSVFRQNSKINNLIIAAAAAATAASCVEKHYCGNLPYLIYFVDRKFCISAVTHRPSVLVLTLVGGL